MCLSKQTSQEYKLLARKRPILYSKFNLEGHSTESLILEILRHTLIVNSNLKRIVQQCFFSHSAWPHWQSFTHLTNIYGIPTTCQALLSQGPHISEGETNKPTNSILHNQCHDRKVKSVVCTQRRNGWWSNLNEGWEWGPELGKASRRIYITCRWRSDDRGVERKHSRQKEEQLQNPRRQQKEIKGTERTSVCLELRV